MKWYLAKLVYQVITGEGKHRAQFDEQWRLIQADEWDWAREKANVMGHIGAFTFQNKKKEPVQWKFIEVVDIVEIEAWEDGEQIYSATAEPEEVDQYLEVVKWQAKRVKEMVMEETTF